LGSLKFQTNQPSSTRCRAISATRLVSTFFPVFWLVGQTQIASFGGRVAFILLAGILAAIGTNVSYWNWYGFPGAYTVRYMLIEVIGFLLVGIVAGLMLRKLNTAG